MNRKLRLLIFSLIPVFIILSASFIPSGNTINLDEKQNSENSDYIKLNIAELYYLSKHDPEFENKRYMVRGVVFRNEKFSSGTFGLLRFMIVCCYADAVPMVLPVKYDKADSVEADTWLNIYGSFDKKDDDGKNGFLLIAEKIEIIDPEKISREDIYIFEANFEEPYCY